MSTFRVIYLNEKEREAEKNRQSEKARIRHEIVLEMERILKLLESFFPSSRLYVDGCYLMEKKKVFSIFPINVSLLSISLFSDSSEKNVTCWIYERLQKKEDVEASLIKELTSFAKKMEVEKINLAYL